LIAPDIYLNLSDLLATIFLIVAVILLVVAAYGDMKNRRIPNTLTAAVAILGILRLVVLGDPIAASYTVGVAFMLLSVTFVLFSFRLIGGGDVKLLTATVLVIGYHAVFPLLAIISICGALLAIAMLLWLMTVKTNKKPSVPYGVAIAAGAIVTLFLQSSMIG
jgi:prepilin peptidase CpaA